MSEEAQCEHELYGERCRLIKGHSGLHDREFGLVPAERAPEPSPTGAAAEVKGTQLVENWAEWIVTRHNFCECEGGESLKEIAIYALKEFLRMALAAQKEAPWTCKARSANMGANDPQDCNWPFCGCDRYADQVLEAVSESQTITKGTDLYSMIRNEIEACARIIDDCNHAGPYQAIAGASAIRARKSLYAKVIQSDAEAQKEAPDAVNFDPDDAREALGAVWDAAVEACARICDEDVEMLKDVDEATAAHHEQNAYEMRALKGTRPASQTEEAGK